MMTYIERSLNTFHAAAGALSYDSGIVVLPMVHFVSHVTFSIERNAMIFERFEKTVAYFCIFESKRKEDVFIVDLVAGVFCEHEPVMGTIK